MLERSDWSRKLLLDRIDQIVNVGHPYIRSLAELKHIFFGFGWDLRGSKENDAHVIFLHQIREICGSTQNQAAVQTHPLNRGNIIVHQANDFKNVLKLSALEQPIRYLTTLARPND